MKKAIVSGVGPIEGLGAQLCIRFATKGLHVLVAGRTQAKLDAVVSNIEANGGSAEAVVADSTSESETVALFDRAGSDLDVAIYNTGNNTQGVLLICPPNSLRTAGEYVALVAFFLVAKR